MNIEQANNALLQGHRVQSSIKDDGTWDDVGLEEMVVYLILNSDSIKFRIKPHEIRVMKNEDEQRT